MINKRFSSKFFSANRARLKKSLPEETLIVLTANGLLQRGGDTSFPFCQDASFWYLTGCDEPDILLVFDKDGEYLIVPKREDSRMAFDGMINESELLFVSGVKDILESEKGWERLKPQLIINQHVATLGSAPDYIELLGMYTNPARQRLINSFKSHNPKLKLLDVSQNMIQLRAIKQSLEIQAIQSAIDITSVSLSKIFQLARQGKFKYEYEIEAELNRDFRRQGAGGHAFAPIIASGERACTLHNVQNSSTLSKGDLMLCDVGANYDHYAADITRTISLSNPSQRQKSVYKAVLETQIFALSLLRPGVMLKDYERQVEKFLGKQLQSLGLIKNISREAVHRFTPHAISHFLGLNAHDIGSYDQPLQAGMVITVEPGIYIKQESIGIRIEDDVLITTEGNQVLSDFLSHSLV
ncbi:MAG: aminopeptidase P N-terminal domain-containing protein [Candidatus Saccharimonadales bacterium]